MLEIREKASYAGISNAAEVLFNRIEQHWKIEKFSDAPQGNPTQFPSYGLSTVSTAASALGIVGEDLILWSGCMTVNYTKR